MNILELLHAGQIVGSLSDAAKEVSSSKWGAARLMVGVGATAIGFAFGGVPGALLGLGASELFFQTAPAVWHWIENKWHSWFGQAQTMTSTPDAVAQTVTQEPSLSNQAGILKSLGQTVGNLNQTGHQVVDELADGEASRINKVSLPIPRPSAIGRRIKDELEQRTHSLRM